MTNTISTNRLQLLNNVLEQQKNARHATEDGARFFERFTAEQILKDYKLSDDEIESGLVGGSGDGGVDGFYLFVNGDLDQEDKEYKHLKSNVTINLIIFQATRHEGFRETAVGRLVLTSTDIFDLSGENLASSAYDRCLAQAIRRFHEVYKDLAHLFPTLNVDFHYASLGSKPTKHIEHKVKRLKETVTASIEVAKPSFQFWGAAELLQCVRKSPSVTCELQVAEMPISTTGQAGFVCLVSLTDFFNFITDEKGALRNQLFEANVRDYQGHIHVNSEIQKSLNNAKEDFWWLNNGISIISTKSDLAGGKTLMIRDPLIVNGLQTSREIYNYFTETAKTDSETRKILVRVMVTNEEDSSNRVIKATNSQTAVPYASLLAADEIQWDIEEHLKTKGLFYDRRKNYYKNDGKPRNQIVRIPYLAQAVMAITLRQPNIARARPSSLLKKNSDYYKVFRTTYPLDLYFVCVEGLRKIELCLKSPNLNVQSADYNNLKFYVAMHAIAGVGKSRKPPKKIAAFDISKLNETTVGRSLDFVRKKYDELGGGDRVAKGPDLLEAILGTK